MWIWIGEARDIGIGVRGRNRFGYRPIKSSKEKEQRQYQETGERNQARAPIHQETSFINKRNRR
ncbi:hypothetical protein [Alkalicoccobacillus plakortidis]|uniref:Uncharacterized protein n=1 Tax=Alkalicoccobacillus plakortidis TaxID=444060 RepID=A0ABT0XL93_9BACI|nr:hypothetical protein [Alkalicoccobacillus plakortidis]MCM2676480.1 hypothetical protein [Alkalicoccobacillus plakortidis]